MAYFLLELGWRRRAASDHVHVVLLLHDLELVQPTQHNLHFLHARNCFRVLGCSEWLHFGTPLQIL